MKITKQFLKQIIKEELDASMNEQELDEGFMDFFGGNEKSLESELNSLYEELLALINEWGLKNKDLLTNKDLQTKENAAMLATLQSISRSLASEVAKARGK